MTEEPRHSPGRISLIAAGAILLVSGAALAVFAILVEWHLLLDRPDLIGISDRVYQNGRAYFLIVGAAVIPLAVGIAFLGYGAMAAGRNARVAAFAGAILIIVLGFTIGSLLPTGPVLTPLIGVVVLLLVGGSEAQGRKPLSRRVGSGLAWPGGQPTGSSARAAIITAGVVLLVTGLVIAIVAGIALVPALDVRYINVDQLTIQALGTILRATLIGAIAFGAVVAVLGYVAIGAQGRALVAAVAGGILCLVAAVVVSGVLPLGPWLPFLPGGLIIILAVASVSLSRREAEKTPPPADANPSD